MPAPPAPGLRDHLRAIRRMVGVILLILLFTVIYFARDLLLPVVIGLMMALTLSPITRWLGRHGVPPPAAATLIMVLALAALAGGMAAVGTQVGDWADNLPEISAQVRRKLSALFESLARVRDLSDQMGEVAQGTDGMPADRVVVQQPGLLSDAVSGIASIGTSVIAGCILALFLLGAGRTVHEKLIGTFQRLGDKKRALRIAYEIEYHISRYLLTITVINAGLGLLVGIWLWLLGVPYYAAWGIMAFVLNFLPFLGGIIGQILVGTYALVALPGMAPAALAVAGYFCLNAIEGQVVTPWLLGRSLRINTVSVFLAVILWAWLWDVPGALMAVPVLVSVKVACDHIPSLGWLGNLLGPASDPPEAERGSEG
ncbi:AI-2E family transporter [Ruixingdingia sedimenti]|uniref:AI-2E family transporter n=1 Tax=Ruixingdingia sedimenti TaxID=3073604 RepID=A0ABU1F661_9RHOB|nr:AI-2E family transporter [Xinfangfangia sp. LG-4]MDR5651924.1 AI-2E family transporter [Xinfangfangia sp. LG-4]